MLEPDGRQPLLDALRPPPGYTLDRAVGTTYSLDLAAMLTAPLAFAMFDRASADGDLLGDAIALLEAVRRHADRIDVFCQAGQIAPMREHRTIISHVEEAVHPVLPPDPRRIFHPKIWVLRFRSRDDDELRYRFLCLSRNLTFDRSWDTLLRLDGVPAERDAANAPLAEFVRSLGRLAVNEIQPPRRDAIDRLATEVESIAWELPEQFRELRFWPLGHDGQERWPFEGRIDRMLVVSPFLTAATLKRLSSGGRRNVLVSRTESLDFVGTAALPSFGEIYALAPHAIANPDPENEAESEEVETSVATESLAEAAERQLEGLHAKCYIADAGSRARVWTGSANATDPAFWGNVEFLVELEGYKHKCGIEATLGGGDGPNPTFRSLLEEYRPSNEEPRKLTEDEQLDLSLDEQRRLVGGLRFTAQVTDLGGDEYRIDLVGRPARDGQWDHVESLGLRCRPLSTPGAATRLRAEEGALAASFPRLSFEGLTSFFVLTAEATIGRTTREVDFVINAELLGAPADRRQRILAQLLTNRHELMQFLLLLLSGIGDAGFLMAGQGGKAWADGRSFGSPALLEPMIRALARDPERLDEIAGLIQELSKTDEGRRLLPDGWELVWGPIWQARSLVVAQRGTRDG